MEPTPLMFVQEEFDGGVRRDAPEWPEHIAIHPELLDPGVRIRFLSLIQDRQGNVVVFNMDDGEGAFYRVSHTEDDGVTHYSLIAEWKGA